MIKLFILIMLLNSAVVYARTVTSSASLPFSDSVSYVKLKQDVIDIAIDNAVTDSGTRVVSNNTVINDDLNTLTAVFKSAVVETKTIKEEKRKCGELICLFIKISVVLDDDVLTKQIDKFYAEESLNNFILKSDSRDYEHLKKAQKIARENYKHATDKAWNNIELDSNKSLLDAYVEKVNKVIKETNGNEAISTWRENESAFINESKDRNKYKSIKIEHLVNDYYLNIVSQSSLKVQNDGNKHSVTYTLYPEINNTFFSQFHRDLSTIISDKKDVNTDYDYVLMYKQWPESKPRNIQSQFRIKDVFEKNKVTVNYWIDYACFEDWTNKTLITDPDSVYNKAVKVRFETPLTSTHFKAALDYHATDKFCVIRDYKFTMKKQLNDHEINVLNNRKSKRSRVQFSM